MILQAFVLWIHYLINQIRRIHYTLHHAIDVIAVYNRTGKRAQFSFEYNGKPYSVYVAGPESMVNWLTDGKQVKLRWIPEKKGAMLSEYADDSKSRKAVLICDIISIVSFAGLLAVCAAVSLGVSKADSSASLSQFRIILTDAVVVGAIVLLIVMWRIRKKYKGSITVNEPDN